MPRYELEELNQEQQLAALRKLVPDAYHVMFDQEGRIFSFDTSIELTTGQLSSLKELLDRPFKRRSEWQKSALR